MNPWEIFGWVAALSLSVFVAVTVGVVCFGMLAGERRKRSTDIMGGGAR